MEETFQLRWGILAYRNYSDLVNCPTIDVIYIATPHSHHFQNAMLALEAGKHVLCEKNFTVNAGQAKKLSTVAEKKQRFLMEGLWTRFLPVSVEVRQFLQAGAIGTVTRVFADNGLGMDPYSDFLPGDLMVVKELAGGALLDREFKCPPVKLSTTLMTDGILISWRLFNPLGTPGHAQDKSSPNSDPLYHDGIRRIRSRRDNYYPYEIRP
ncbi:unnamed protein product [Aspergillus oryzae]|uniref:D-xylose 1-dehydrogenase (NADP(+), D-xylono-1,5-lactone-forming) n=1 Tax=Aspergillus oryzae TaxID=5062 RepID=A0AAN5C2X6_ASPOZ|nr:unnamed protein product [Aspergillus oryzae]GMG37047.1 unnamed protein product [Aspergillus oryzae]